MVKGHDACILTFVTRSGRRCFYATRLPDEEDCGDACLDFELPPGVQTQLDAMKARQAWRYLATPRPLAVRGPAAAEVEMVTDAADDEFERVVFR